MKIDRRTFIKKMNCGLAGIIGLLGFVSCEKIGAKEYGTPHADYTVKGTVVNKATQNPIKGIRVGFSCELCPIAEYGTLPTPYKPKAHVLTDTKGEFTLTDRFQGSEYKIIDNKPTLSVWVEDIDGEKNGRFQNEHLQVDMSGRKTVTITVEMTEIEINK